MLPKARAPIVQDPTFPMDGVSMPGSANHNFRMKWRDWWLARKLSSSSSCFSGLFCSMQFLNKLDLLFRNLFPFSYLFPFFFWLLPQWHSNAVMFSARQEPGSRVPGAALPFSRQHRLLAKHCCWEGGGGKGGKKILLDLQMIFCSSKVSFLVSDRAQTCALSQCR